jgi:hypothetical protein
MPKGRRDVLLRVANVNPDSVITHTDRVLYSAIGVFILLYFVYATVGGAAFIDASSNYQQPWYRWLVGPLVAAGVVAFDRAVVGRVSISYDDLESTDPREFLRKPTLGLYLGRLGLAVLFAVIITEPLMLARYQGEIDARLNQVHNQQLSRIDTSGVIGTWTARLLTSRWSPICRVSWACSTARASRAARWVASSSPACRSSVTASVSRPRERRTRL